MDDQNNKSLEIAHKIMEMVQESFSGGTIEDSRLIFDLFYSLLINAIANGVNAYADEKIEKFICDNIEKDVRYVRNKLRMETLS